MRKALRQREWAIYIHPYYTTTKGNKVYYAKDPKAMKFADFGEGVAGSDTGVVLKGREEGKETGGTMVYDEGGWVMWYKTNSFPKLREKFKELLETCPKEHTRVAELLPVDTLITPLS